MLGEFPWSSAAAHRAAHIEREVQSVQSSKTLKKSVLERVKGFFTRHLGEKKQNKEGEEEEKEEQKEKEEEKRSAAPPPMPVAITGHSLGGALATLAAFELAAVGTVPTMPRTEHVLSVAAGAGEQVRDGRGGRGSSLYGYLVRGWSRMSEKWRIMATGGAAAAAADADAAVEVVGVWTFGSPRVGDALFAEAFRAAIKAETWRVTHSHDIVPSVRDRDDAAGGGEGGERRHVRL